MSRAADGGRSRGNERSVPERLLGRFRSLRKAELHLHLEGAIRGSTLVGLSRRNAGMDGLEPRFPDLGTFRKRRRLGGFSDFLLLYRDVCRELRGPADYALVAGDLCRRLRRERIAYAEVYVSPAVVERIGLRWDAVVTQLDGVFARHERLGGGRVRVLLDSVRQWGPEAAARVLDLHEQTRWDRVVGFGLGGDESSVPARAFSGIYRRARALSLAGLVHAGEWGGPDAVAEALEQLRPVRIAHGIAAAADPALVRRLARSGVVLDVCPASNRATGALGPGRRHPALELLRAGVRISLGTDDPGLFGTTLRREYLALCRLGATARELRTVLATGLSAALDLGHGR